jgi:hypothetical protein
MKTRTIEKAIAAKVEAFAATLPTELGDRVRKGTIVAGGCIASMLLQEPVNDYDLYFTTQDLALDVARHFGATRGLEAKLYDGRITFGTGAHREQFVPDITGADPDPDASDEVKEEESKHTPPFSPLFITNNAISLTSKTQLVIRFWGTPEEILKNFDYVHCTNYWSAETGLHLNTEALTSLLTKELRYVGSLYPLCSLIRLRKFLKRGFTCNAGQMLKMMFQVSQLDLADIRTLQDQLIGVDSVYFISLISALRETQGAGGVIDTGTVCEAVDRIFG